jgi:cell division protein FtsL
VISLRSGRLRWVLLNLCLVIGVLGSALGAVITSHHSRAMFAELQGLQADQWSMQEQWGRLLLEESTWAHHHRVEEVATRRLQMVVPAAAEVEVLAP